MPCQLCGEHYFDEGSDAHYSSDLDILVCDDCLKCIEEHHKVDGKYVVYKCSECGKVKKVEWISYKKRGRKSGSRNKQKYVKGQTVLVTET